MLAHWRPFQTLCWLRWQEWGLVERENLLVLTSWSNRTRTSVIDVQHVVQGWFTGGMPLLRKVALEYAANNISYRVALRFTRTIWSPDVSYQGFRSFNNIIFAVGTSKPHCRTDYCWIYGRPLVCRQTRAGIGYYENGHGIASIIWCRWKLGEELYGIGSECFWWNIWVPLGYPHKPSGKVGGDGWISKLVRTILKSRVSSALLEAAGPKVINYFNDWSFLCA